MNAISVLKLNTHQKPAHVTERLLETMERILLFNSLDEEDKRTLVDAMFKRETVSGECVIRQGSDGDNFYIVEMGLFDVYIQGVHLGEYDNIGQFGELALMYNCPRAATVLSVGAGALWCLDRDTFRNITLGKAAAQRRLYDEALKTNPLIKDLSEAERTKLADSLEKVGFKDNERIIHQGDPADAMYLIVAGHAKVTRHVAASSTEVLIDTLGSGQYFGELALLTDKPRAASVWAKGPLTCASKSATLPLVPCVAGFFPPFCTSSCIFRCRGRGGGMAWREDRRPPSLPGDVAQRFATVCNVCVSIIYRNLQRRI